MHGGWGVFSTHWFVLVMTRSLLGALANEWVVAVIMAPTGGGSYLRIHGHILTNQQLRLHKYAIDDAFVGPLAVKTDIIITLFLFLSLSFFVNKRRV